LICVKGGLKLTDIYSFNNALKASWINRFSDPLNVGKWKCLFKEKIKKYGGELLFK